MTDTTIIRDATFVASAATFEQLPGPVHAEVTFAGRSNVGKSSLINCLVSRKNLVRTSNTPGCTRAINIFRVDLKVPEASLDLVDLPGYGFAKRSKNERDHWAVMIETFLRNRPGLRGIVSLVDARRGLDDEERDLIKFAKAVDQPLIMVATKVDKLPKSKRKNLLEALSRDAGRRLLPFSSVTGDGRDALWQAILKMAHIET